MRRALVLAALCVPFAAPAEEPPAEEPSESRVVLPEARPPWTKPGDVWIEAGGGRVLADQPWILASSWEGVARVGVVVSQSSQVELEGTTGWGQVRRGESGFDSFSGRVAWMTMLAPEERVTAYISLGLGVYWWRLDDPDGVHPNIPDKRVEMLGAFGPGVRIALTPFLALRSDFRSMSLITGKSWANFEWTATVDVRAFRRQRP